MDDAELEKIVESADEVRGHILRYHYHTLTGWLLKDLSKDEGHAFILRNMMAYDDASEEENFANLTKKELDILTKNFQDMSRRDFLLRSLIGGSAAVTAGSIGYRKMRGNDMGPNEEKAVLGAAIAGFSGVMSGGTIVAAMGKAEARNQALGAIAAYREKDEEEKKQYAENLIASLEPELRQRARQHAREREAEQHHAR